MRKIYYILLFFIGLSQNSEAQTLKAFITAAEEAVAIGDLHNAMHYYNEAVLFDTTDLAMRYNFAETLLEVNAYTPAEKEFQFIVDNDADKMHPLASYHLGSAQRNIGKYAEAKRNFELYLSENEGDDENYTTKARKEIEAIEWSMERNAEPTPGVEVSILGGEVNTEYTEFGATKINDKLYYSSLRYEEQENDRRVDRLFSKILTDNEEGMYVPITDSDSDQKLEKGEVREHVAHTAFNRDGDKVYFTICQYKSETDIRCDLFVADVQENGLFSGGNKLSGSINSPNHTTTQPSYGYDPILGKEVLYFSSDREGGKGGLDIWYTTIEEDGFGDPVNISSINTLQDEITPFYHSASATLYFSSEGYLGLGGFDIYQTYKSEEGFAQPVNLMPPTNGSFNDIYYVLNDEGTEAHFSTNRPPSQYIDPEFQACCYDIWKADIEERFLKLIVLTFNQETEEPLISTRVRIFDSLTDELLYEDSNQDGNGYDYEIKCGKEYTVITDKDGYESDTTSFVIRECNDDVTKKIFLTPKNVKLDVFTFIKPSGEDLEGVRIEIVDLTMGGDPIVFTNEKGNDFHFDIVAGRKYELTATKDDYDDYVEMFTADGFVDGLMTKDIFMGVEIIPINEYLPVVVYFDNDNPDQRSRKLYSTQSYSETYFPFIAKKQEFKDKYTNSMSGDIKFSSQQEIETFFENEVKFGFNRLQTFIGKLKQMLDRGDIVELSLKGFASPRAANKYNLALGQRRIWTLKNELRTYNEGILSPYIDSGKLLVSEISFGEEIAPNGISDSYSNRRLSVYSVEASRQRKAEIVRVRVLN